MLALIAKNEVGELIRQRLPTMRLHAPHLVDAEVGSVLRRHELAGRINAEEARSALNAGSLLVEHR